MDRRSFLGTIMAVLITPLVAKFSWAKPKPLGEYYTPSNIVDPACGTGGWLKLCPGCGDFYPDLVRTEYKDTEVAPGYVYAIYTHNGNACGVTESKYTRGYYQIHGYSSADCNVSTAGSFQGLPDNTGYVEINR